MTDRTHRPSPRRLQAGLLVAAALALSACKPSQPAASPKPPTPPVAVRMTPATERPIPRFIRVTGQLLGYQDALVAADLGGKVSETRVERGSKVSKGDVLVQIDNRGPTLSLQEAEASLALAQARLALARSDVERNAPLVQTRAVAEADFRRFEADLAIREAELAGARSRRDQALKNLDDCTTRAPFSGVVVERFVQPGEYVRADSRIVRLVELARIRLVLNVPEPLSGGIQPGQAVDFQTAAFPGQSFAGEVRFVSSAVREATRDLQIEAEVANADERLRPGFFAEARIRTGDQKATTIPTSALRTEGNRRSVFLVEGNTLVERLVEVGDAIEGWVEIRRGLTNGTPVVNPAEPRLADGLPAQVTQP